MTEQSYLPVKPWLEKLRNAAGLLRMVLTDGALGMVSVDVG